MAPTSFTAPTPHFWLPTANLNTTELKQHKKNEINDENMRKKEENDEKKSQELNG